MGKLNPQITTTEIGIKSLREVTIYPLSLADQTKTARILAKAFQEVMEKLSSFGTEEGVEEEGLSSIAKQLSDVDILEFIASAIQDNLEVVLALVVADNEEIRMEELTNEQFYRLVEIIYEVNYEATSKNFITLVKRVRGVVPPEKKTKKGSPSKKSSPQSAGGTATG